LPHSPYLEAIPLGGLGEFGVNLMLYRLGREGLLVDVGMGFPGPAAFGVDVVLPDLSFLEDCGTLHAVVLSHGHDDHIGGLRHLLARHDLPVYGPPHALALARERLAEAPDFAGARLQPLPGADAPVQLGPFAVGSLAVAHSIPHARMVLLRTPLGSVLHTADFKLSGRTHLGETTDLDALSALGEEGLLALFADSTNADRPGTTPAERLACETLAEQIRGCRQRVLVCCFASHIERLAALGSIAEREGRKLALIGGSLCAQAELAQRLGLLRFPPGVQQSVERVMALPRRQALIVASGSQGEPRSAFARVARDDHHEVSLDPDDLVIHSARIIPGNERQVGRRLDALLQRGVRVVTAADVPVHVSGHASRDELAELLARTRPRYLVPIHGEQRQLCAHAALARDCGLPAERLRVARSGDLLAVGPRELAVVDRVHVGRVQVDADMAPVAPALLAERRRIAEEGIVLPVLAVDRTQGTIQEIRIVSRGFAPGANGSSDALWEEARRVVARSWTEASPRERDDARLFEERLRVELRRFLRRRTRRRPLIQPVIVES